MVVGVGVKSELKDLGELVSYFDKKGEAVPESIMVIWPFGKEKNRNDPIIEVYRRELEKIYNRVDIVPRETKEGKVSGLSIWVGVKRA